MTQAGTSFYSRQTYFPYGAQRTTEGSALPTDNTFTGQKSDDSTELMFYNARYYDATLGRFIQPDTIVPNPLNPQSLNRFAYVQNNPVRYADPTGHMMDDGLDGGCGICGPSTPPSNGGNTPSETNAQPPADTASDQTTNEGTCQGPRRKCDPDYDHEIDEDPVMTVDSPAYYIANGYYDYPWQLYDRVAGWFRGHPDYNAVMDPNFEQYGTEISVLKMQYDGENLAKSHESLTLDKAFLLATPVLAAITGGGSRSQSQIQKSINSLEKEFRSMKQNCSNTLTTLMPSIIKDCFAMRQAQKFASKLFKGE